MHVISNGPVPLLLRRNGGTIIVARLDYWQSTPNGWDLAGSNLFQQVALRSEPQQAPLAPGIYTVKLTCYVEESINGVYAFDMSVAGNSVGSGSGNVNTTTSPHDSKAYKDQFVLTVQ